MAYLVLKNRIAFRRVTAEDLISGMGLGVASMGLLHRFLDDETGATAIEYGLIVGLVSVGTVGGIGYYGETLLALYEEGILAKILAAI